MRAFLLALAVLGTWILPATAGPASICSTPMYDGVCCDTAASEYVWPSGNGCCYGGQPYPGPTCPLLQSTPSPTPTPSIPPASGLNCPNPVAVTDDFESYAPDQPPVAGFQVIAYPNTEANVKAGVGNTAQGLLLRDDNDQPGFQAHALVQQTIAQSPSGSIEFDVWAEQQTGRFTFLLQGGTDSFLDIYLFEDRTFRYYDSTRPDGSQYVRIGTQTYVQNRWYNIRVDWTQTGFDFSLDGVKQNAAPLPFSYPNRVAPADAFDLLTGWDGQTGFTGRYSVDNLQYPGCPSSASASPSASSSPSTSPSASPSTSVTASPTAAPSPIPSATLPPNIRPDASIKLTCPSNLVITSKITIAATTQTFGQPTCDPQVQINVTAPRGQNAPAVFSGCANGRSAFNVTTAYDGAYTVVANYSGSVDTCRFAIAGTPPTPTPELGWPLLLAAALLAGWTVTRKTGKRKPQ